jgi:hypothetical protein
VGGGSEVSSLISWSLVALVVLPVAAACWLGLFLRSLVIERGGGPWGAWLVLLAVSSALWVYLFVEMVP